MNIKTERLCEGCGKESKRKHLKKIRKNYYCKQCSVKIRKDHRKETYENSDDKERIRELNSELKNKTIFRERRKRRAEKIILNQSQPPKPKGSKKTRVDKNNCFITFQEKRDLFRILMNRGIDPEEAKERIKNLVVKQREIRKEMITQNKSEEEIKIKRQKMIENLWRY